MVRSVIRKAVSKLDRAVRRDGVRGYLDGYIDGQLHGWVRKIDSDDPLRIDIFLDGELAHRDVISDRDRADLRAEGVGQGTFGFQVPVDSTGVSGKVDVTVRLAGEATTVLAGVITVPTRGAPQVGSGQGMPAPLADPMHADPDPVSPDDPGPAPVPPPDPDPQFDSAPEDATDDGRPAVTSGTGPSGESPAQPSGKRPAQSSGKRPAQPSGKSSAKTAKTKSRPAATKSEPKSKPEPSYKLRIEQVSETRLGGWAVDLSDPGAIFKMDIYVNGEFFLETRNDAKRPDLRKLGLSRGRGGIEQVLPRGLLDSGAVTVALRLPNGQQIERKFDVTVSGAQPAAITPRMDTAVSIVVPVYNALEDTEICIDRLLAHTTTPARVILIDDASPDAAIAPLLARYADHPHITVLTNDTNMGFTRTVNRGIAAAGTDDVIFLNSDARVTPGWIEGLRAAAASDPRIGTVTPLSDRAGAFSAPRIGNANPLPFGVDEAEYAVAVRRHSLRLYPTVPTGNGFCMYVRRACIDAVGPLDEEAFPRGYGEENDFCMRARALGWRSVIDDATYVFHERSKSFGETKTDLMVAGRKTVDARHPDYSYAIKVFGSSPQIALARYQAGQAAAALAAHAPQLPRALFVTATATGGTPQTNRDLMAALGGAWDCWLLRCDGTVMTLARMEASGRMEAVAAHTLQEPVSPTRHRSFEYDRVLAAWLARHEFDLVHIRQLIWHSLSLPRLAREAGAVVINSFHDFYTISPSVKLLDEDNVFCGAMCADGKAYAESDLWPKNAMPRLDRDWITIWQRQFAEALSVCDAFVTTSPSARDMILRTLPGDAAERFVVIPHGRDFPDMRQSVNWPSPEEPVRILVPGNISLAKGRAVIEGLLERDAADQRLEFHILGDHDFPGERRGLHFHGLYDRDQFAARVARIAPHVGAVFSIWDETYCHTLTEMWAVSLPVVGLEYPTVAGRIRAANGGWVYDERDLDALYAGLVADMGDTDGFMARLRSVIEWQRGAGRANTTRMMASRYQALYQEVLDTRRHLRGPDAAPVDPHAADARRIAVVSPAGARLDQAPASTHVRVWARTFNAPDRAASFVRLTPEELLAAVRTGDIDKAVIQRNAIPVQIWRGLRPLVAAGRLTYALDLDDDLTGVPADKDPDGAYGAYAPVLEDIIAHAAVVTASTTALAGKIAPLNPSVEVVPNLLSGRIWRGRLPRRREDGMVRGLYMGNRSHDGDFALVHDAFAAAARDNPNLRLRLVGALQEPPADPPAWLEVVDIPKKARDYPAFVAWLRTQCSDLDFGIAPLADSAFNTHKSYLKVLDYAGLGLPVIASRHSVYAPLEGPDHITLVDNTSADWEHALNEKVQAGPVRDATRRAVRDWVGEAHHLEGTLAEYDALLRAHLGKDLGKGTT